jgi:membrane protease YdiL (CAAX protease family)
MLQSLQYEVLKMDNRNKALLGLFLVGIAPTVSILVSFGTGEGLLGQIFWFISKLWMLGLPLFWRLKVDNLPISWSKPQDGGFKEALIIGGVFAIIMLAAWLVFGIDNVDSTEIKTSLEPVGLTVASTYIAAALFWIFGNSVLEEYVFRWFIVEKAEVVINGIWKTVFLSAGIFVIHHFIALFFLGFPLWINLMACLGLFVGGSAFSWLYIKYRSIWVPFITHAICDVVVFGIGYWILFA